MKTTLNSIPHLAKKIAKSIKGGEIFALIGDLGSGKTTFTKTLGKALKIKHHITSPTFVLMNRYPFKLKTRKLYLYHLDIYRLKNFKDILALGINEIWGQKDTVTVIEWADKIKKYLPKKTVKIHFKTH
jgi:tRNA threonylcarbamoyladenosine biosynthesis protein TsaE